MTKKQLINFLNKNKDILSIRAIAIRPGFLNLPKVLAGQVDNRGFAFTFPDKHIPKVIKQLRRLQSQKIQ